MAGERALPGLGLRAYWTAGSNGWNTQHDEDIRLASAVTQLSVIAQQATLPGAPVNGEIYLATGAWGGGATQDIMAYDNGGWVVITPNAGWLCFDQGTGTQLLFTGTAWVDLRALMGDSVQPAAKTADFSVDNAMLAGNVAQQVDFSVAGNITINAGLVNKAPCTFISVGAAIPTFVAGVGVTIVSYSSLLSFAGLGASVTLVPDKLNSETYILIGLLA